MRLSGIAGLLAVLSLAQDQQPVPRFRSGVEVVVLDVTVLDKDRRPVRGLSATDFTVLEDGRPQAIVSFEELSAPEPDGALVPWMREVAPDIRTNAADHRRIVTLILDDVNVSFRYTETVKQIGRKIVDQLGPSDQLCVIYTGNNKKSQAFTNDRAVLRAAVERYVDTTLPPKGFGGSDMPGQYATETVRRASETLKAIPHRRKALIFVSSLAVNFGDQNLDTGHLLSQALRAAQAANITIYPINPAGLEFENSSAGFPAPQAGLTLATPPGGSTRDLASETARTIANETGGFAVTDTNTFDAQINQIFRETGAYYLVGFASAHRDGKLRRIDVKVGRPGLLVRTRSTYRAPGDERDDKKKRADALPLMKSLASVLPDPDVPMRIAAAAFPTARGDAATIAIVLGIQQPAPPEGRAAEKVDVAITAYDTSYRNRGFYRQTAQLTLRPTEGNDAKYEILSKLDLPPGRYQLRLAVHSALLRKSGSVFHDIEVPDFRRRPLTLSGVVIAVDPALPAAPKDYLASVVPITPTTQRNFAPSDVVTVFLRVHQGGRRPPEPVSLTVSLIDSGDRIVHRRTDALEPAQSHEYRFALPLDRLEPGPHLLRITASAGREESSHEVRVFVRPGSKGFQ